MVSLHCGASCYWEFVALEGWVCVYLVLCTTLHGPNVAWPTADAQYTVNEGPPWWFSGYKSTFQCRGAGLIPG